MDYQTLMNRKGLDAEIRQLEYDIAAKETEKSAAISVLSHSPRSPSVKHDKIERLAVELVDLRNDLKRRQEERNEVQRYISSLKNSDARTALRLHCLHGYSWEAVANKMTTMGRSYSKGGIYKKCMRILKMGTQETLSMK